MMFMNDHAHIWYIEFDDFDSYNIEELYVLLNDEEKKKANSFARKKDKENYVISHGCLRALLTQYHPKIDAGEWEFLTNNYGKPFISKKHKVDFFFNLSHTYSGAAIIFDQLSECGIDIEEDRELELNDSIVNLVLSENERRAYEATASKREFFYKLWVLKEAYTKALGIGIYKKFDQIDFSTASLCSCSNNKLFIEKYQCRTWNIRENFFLSACITQKNKYEDIEFYRYRPLV